MGRPQVIQAFEVSPYNDGTFILKNSRSAAYAIISEYQAFLMELLERDNKVSSLLFPENGIATMKHFEQAVDLLGQLRRLEILRFDSETNDAQGLGAGEGGASVSQRPKSSPGLLQPVAEAILEFASGLLGKVSTWLLFAPTIIATISTILLFPDPGQRFAVSGPSQWAWILITLYVGVTLSLNLRAIFRAGYLKRSGRQAFQRRFRWLGPFLTLELDERDLWMAGYGARLRMALVGLFSPSWIALSALAAFHAGFLGLDYTYSICLAAFATILLLLFPLLGEDGEELLHLLFFGRQLERGLAAESLRAIGGGPRQSIRRRVVWTFFATILWSLLWFDSVRTGFRPFFFSMRAHLSAAMFQLEWLSAALTMLIYAFVLFFPVTFLSVEMMRAFLLRKGGWKASGSAGDFNVSDADKIAGLSRIPLFAFLTDADRSSLLLAMESQSYEPGEYLVRQGAQGNELFVLIKGQALAVFRDAAGRIHNVGSLREGDAFGEIGLLDAVPRTASIVANERCLALKLSKAVFEAQILLKAPNVDRIKQMIRLSSFFKRHPLFSRLPAKDQAQIIESLRYRTAVNNEEVTGPRGEGEPKFFIIYSGKFVLVSDREEEILLSSEDCFGYLLPGQNPAYLPTAKVKEAGGLLTLSQEEFRALIFDRIDQNPEIIQC